MIIIICGFLGCIFGIVLTNKHKNRYSFYKELNDFFTHLKHSISFSQNLLKDIIKDFYSNRKKPLFDYQNYLDYLNSKSLHSKFELNNNDYLSKEEKNEIQEYFNQLGKLNLSEEVEKIETKALRKLRQ